MLRLRVIDRSRRRSTTIPRQMASTVATPAARTSRMTAKL